MELVRRGEDLARSLAAPGGTNGSQSAALESAARGWQRECAALVGRLSGGDKGHWLARAHGEAFLVRGSSGHAVEEAPLREIVERILGVLRQALAAVSRAGGTAAPGGTAASRRFDFVREAALRSVLEEAYRESRSALEEGRFGQALTTSCGILEAVVTDALAQAGPGVRAREGASGSPLAEWSFEARLEAAERAGLIRAGWARLPPVARRYRELAGADEGRAAALAVSEDDARRTGQVLHVILRDLDPGR